MKRSEIFARMQQLVEKARTRWNENWSVSMMDYNEEFNQIIVFVGRYDVYKAFFDFDTLECTGTKC